MAKNKDTEVEEQQEPEQQELVASAPAEVKLIRNGMMLVHFVKAHFNREEGERYIGFECSTPLEKEHEGYVPEEVLKMWRVIRGSNPTRIDTTIAPQTVKLGPVPDDASLALKRVGATLVDASLSKVSESGAGKKKKVIRFKFRIVIPFDVDARDFATEYFGVDVWLSMKQTSQKLLEDKEGQEE